MKNKIILADIGNTYFHSYDGEKVEHLAYKNAISKYKNCELYYISVKNELSRQIASIKKWKNISSAINIEGEYDTMGVDRKALCLSHDSGIFVDAGSAITIDVVENGIYVGGCILPGLDAYMKCYASISPMLDVALDKELNLKKELPRTTKEQITYGIIASIKALIDKHSNEKNLYFTGGNGKFLSKFFEDSVYDEMLVFEGMRKAIKEIKIC